MESIIGGIFVRRGRRVLAALLVLFVMAGVIVSGGKALRKSTVPYRVSFCAEGDDAFRAMNISDDNVAAMREIVKEHSIPEIRLIAAYMATHSFALEGKELKDFDIKEFERREEYLQKHYGKEYEKLLVSYGKIWQDVKYFPVAESTTNAEATTSFEDSWMYERTFGGKRGHEGCDIMAAINKRGYYPVISMTDGVVEKIGWLTKGGYRIGVRSPSGGYYYYAHLYKYANDYQVGDVIQAGELIGYMGDSGYGSEGTVGQFAVHLHVGIYINNEEGEEISINPYPVMKYFREKTLQYAY